MATWNQEPAWSLPEISSYPSRVAGAGGKEAQGAGVLTTMNLQYIKHDNKITSKNTHATNQKSLELDIVKADVRLTLVTVKFPGGVQQQD